MRKLKNDYTGKTVNGNLILHRGASTQYGPMWLRKCGNCAREDWVLPMRVGLRCQKCKNLCKVLPNNEACINVLYFRYGKAAADRNVEWLLSKQELTGLIELDCFYCGAAPWQVVTNGHTSMVYTGVDRINNKIGYVFNNCRPCCKRCNAAKSDMTEQEFSRLIEAVYINYVSKTRLRNGGTVQCESTAK